MPASSAAGDEPKTPQRVLVAVQPPLSPVTRQLVAELQLPSCGQTGDREKSDFILRADDRGLSLSATDKPELLPLHIDFHAGARAWRQQHGGAGRLLNRAIGVQRGKRPKVLDATAGFGTDAMALAASGCTVLALERQPVIAALLADALRRAQLPADAVADAATRLQLRVTDSLAFLRANPDAENAEVVYLDPMFPPSGKSALNSKDMRFLLALSGRPEHGEEAALLAAARASTAKRVVVKRRRLAPPLSAASPSYSLSGNRVRFDVYLRSDLTV